MNIHSFLIFIIKKLYAWYAMSPFVASCCVQIGCYGMALLD